MDAVPNASLEMTSTHAVIGLQMADDGFNGLTSFQFCHPLLTQTF